MRKRSQSYRWVLLQLLLGMHTGTSGSCFLGTGQLLMRLHQHI